MTFTIRLWIAAVTIAGTYAVALALGNAGFPTDFAESEFSLAELPTELGKWTGTDVEIEEWVIGQGDFRQIVNRVYRDSSDSAVRVHTAILRPLMGGKLPHMPEVCYRGNGYVVVDNRNFYAESDPGHGVTARLVTFEGHRQRTYVLYWYQFNDVAVADRQALQEATWAVRGKAAWPPMLKVMLSTEGSPNGATDRLLNLAKQIARWSKDFG